MVRSFILIPLLRGLYAVDNIDYIFVLGDLNETYFVGNVDEASLQLVKCTYECLEKAIAIGKYYSSLFCTLLRLNGINSSIPSYQTLDFLINIFYLLLVIFSETWSTLSWNRRNYKSTCHHGRLICGNNLYNFYLFIYLFPSSVCIDSEDVYSFKFQVKSYCGHGIGELFHCAPNIPHYASILKLAF